MDHWPDSNGDLTVAEALNRQPLGVTPRELERRRVDALQEAERPPSRRERREAKQQRRRRARVEQNVHPLSLASGTVILTDATRRIDGTAAAAVVHDGTIVARDVFQARSSNVAEMRGVALAAQYADERGIEEALFLCDNSGVVACVECEKYGSALKGDAKWLRLIAERPGWWIEHVPRRMVREAHRAAALALA